MPFWVGEKINWFYFFGDAVGASATFFYFFYLYYLLERKLVFIEQVYKIIIHSAILISIGIIFNYFLSGGGKVSIPPEIHYSLAIYFVSLGIGYRFGKQMKVWYIAIIVLAIIVSIFRMNLIISAGSLIVGYLWSIFRKGKLGIRTFVLGCLFIAITIFFFGPVLEERFSSLAISEDVSSDNVFMDESANQRFLESTLVLLEMENQNILTLILGKGFGAEYTNVGRIIEHYPERQHQLHMTITSVFLRNGILGLIIFLIPVAFIVFDVFTRNQRLFAASIGLLFTYIALMTDQYLYWGLLYSISLSIWLYSRRNKQINAGD